jgi:MFS family permease
MTANETMSPTEKKAAFSLAFIYMLRMLGLFLILPVFALYAEDLEGATPVLVGLAIGVYGLTQALLQMPFGMLSDRLGRKPVIVAGLLIFAVGSVVAATAHSIFAIIVGRAIQGAGAIAATLMALAADLTREEHRLKVMAVIGASIGVSFSVALIVGPVLNNWIGVPGIFWLTFVLALSGIVVLRFVVPDPVVSRVHRDAEAVPSQFKHVLRDGQLLRLDFGIFALHLILTASFVTVPLALRDSAGLPADQHWLVYLVVMLVAIVAMVPFIIYAEKRRRMKPVFAGAVAVVGVAQLGLAWGYHSVPGTVVALLVFFTAFNVLEASLPSLVAKTAPPDKKGTAMGIYSSSQFFGAFCGGAAGGWLHGAVGVEGVFVFCALVAGVWFMLAITMRGPRYLSSHLLAVGPQTEAQARTLVSELTRVRGVAEAVVVAEEGVAYLKVDSHALDRETLRRFAVGEG